MRRLMRCAIACMRADRYRLTVALLAWALLSLLSMQSVAQETAAVAVPAAVPSAAVAADPAASVAAPAAVPAVNSKDGATPAAAPVAPNRARSAAPTPALVQQPRAYGYTIGDLLQQRIALGSVARPFVPAELPRIGRIGSSLWRRRVAQQVDASGQHWLQIEYQLINTPQSLAVWYLPKLLLKSADGNSSLSVANAAFSIAPFTPPQPYEDAALPALQPDAPPAPVNLAPIMRRVRATSAALLLVLLTWAAVLSWRYLRRGRHLPFASAVRDMRTLRKTPAADPLALQRRLHHALNASAGEVVRPGSVARLLQRAPHLVAERGAIEDFLRGSHASFFGGQAPADPAPVAALAHRLRRLEQRHAR